MCSRDSRDNLRKIQILLKMNEGLKRFDLYELIENTIEKGRVDVVKQLLVQHEHRLDTKFKKKYGGFLLYEAVVQDSLELVPLFLKWEDIEIEEFYIQSEAMRDLLLSDRRVQPEQINWLKSSPGPCRPVDG